MIKDFLKNIGLEYIARETALFLRYYILKFSYGSIKTNTENMRTIPVIIISFNQLINLKKLVSFLLKSGFKNIIIIDNASTYTPLLGYFKEIKKKVRIHRLKRNYGHMVFWRQKEFFMLYGQNYHVVTDADIVPCRQCPPDFLLLFKELLDQNNDITKVGFSLRIDDIPHSNPYRENIVNWEKPFWAKPDGKGNYLADIDTTFALYRPKIYPVNNRFYRAIRTGDPYCARHRGWYFDPDNLTGEQQFYMRTASNSSSWKLDPQGKLDNDEYKSPDE